MRYVLSLGANLGDRSETLHLAIDELKKFILVEAISTFIETDPVGGPEQPRYINAVLIGESAATPAELLERIHGIESSFGRVREVRWGARTLDIDIITAGELVSDDAALTLPHPRAHERAFVLGPWLEIDPDAELPLHGKISHLFQALPASH
jgi:2-amino-4-hydroxy-6-hydroxymethyldihydropteridine diphosphokinase